MGTCVVRDPRLTVDNSTIRVFCPSLLPTSTFLNRDSQRESDIMPLIGFSCNSTSAYFPCLLSAIYWILHVITSLGEGPARDMLVVLLLPCLANAALSASELRVHHASRVRGFDREKGLSV